MGHISSYLGRLISSVQSISDKELVPQTKAKSRIGPKGTWKEKQGGKEGNDIYDDDENDQKHNMAFKSKYLYQFLVKKGQNFWAWVDPLALFVQCPKVNILQRGLPSLKKIAIRDRNGSVRIKPNKTWKRGNA